MTSATLLAQGCLAARPDDFTAQHALAAALAENGRLPEAVASAQRALALARAAGQTATLPLLERTLAAYTAGQPWRQ
jgi:Flp pilus assembly protein TadD